MVLFPTRPRKAAVLAQAEDGGSGYGEHSGLFETSYDAIL
jgi:hypothetical protein